jgi:hypothetical protein
MLEGSGSQLGVAHRRLVAGRDFELEVVEVKGNSCPVRGGVVPVTEGVAGYVVVSDIWA